jgi:histidyl-tRNA synthetase
VLYRLPRGTQDILPAQQPLWRHVARTAEGLARGFGYHRLDTPTFEQAALFVRGVGEGTDIVEREMYTFRDRGDELLTLRPEGTAPVCRAYIEHGMHSLPQPVRLFYFCPVFRYERPQKGRFRQHNQFGVEVIGDADPAVDAEVIELGWRFTQALGLTDLTILVNSIGCPECRPAYLQALRAAYQPHLTTACPDCHLRYERNPLRMLDCKRRDFACQELIAAAPRPTDHLCGPCADHWASLLRYLEAVNIPHRLSHTLVRGLDYYTRTVFEIQPPLEGAQTALLGGGRYDGLIEQLGGRAAPGIGFGSGMERLVQEVLRQHADPAVIRGVDAVLVHVGDGATAAALQLASSLRSQGLSAVLAPTARSLRGQMRHATAMEARYALVLGESEVARGTVQVKNMASGEQTEVAVDEATAAVKRA